MTLLTFSQTVISGAEREIGTVRSLTDFFPQELRNIGNPFLNYIYCVMSETLSPRLFL